MQLSSRSCQPVGPTSECSSHFKQKKPKLFLKEWTWQIAFFMATPLPIHVAGPVVLRPYFSVRFAYS